ncbi:MAG: penicillin acylase family protein [Nitrospirae bacterium]|nr:penicillin acylase family protein [Nitrospirota bacterium]
MRRRATVLAAGLILSACSQKTLGEGALFDMAVNERVSAKGLDARVEVVRDVYGVPHIYGKSEGDVAFAQGYIHAKDRLFQMIIQRAAATGELAILLGGSMVADDIQARMFRYYKVAEALFRSGDMTPEENRFLQRYADGVNAYLKSMNPEEMPLEFLAQGISDPKLLYGSLLNARDGDPGWSPLDSLAFARLMTFLLSFDNEGGEGTRYESINTFLVKELVNRKVEADATAASKTALGYMQDLFVTTPLRNAIVAKPGSFGKFEKTPARSSAARRDAKGVDGPAPGPLPTAGFDGLDSYINNLRKLTGLNPTSNNWVVRGLKTESGYPMLANDPHLSLQQPSVFHEAHLNTETQGGDLNVAGVMFPLAPGIAIGFNQKIAWGETVVGYDVTDFYVETLTKADGSPDKWTVKFQGADRPLKANQDTLIFAPGSSPEGKCALPKSVKSRLDDMLVTYSPPTYEEALSRCVMSNFFTYEVEGHGPVVRVVRDAQGVATSLVTVRWTGFDPTFELRAFKGYLTAKGIDDFEAAVKNFKVGAQNQVVIDSNDNIGWFPNALVPDRDSAKCASPFYLPLPGDGSCDWKGFIDEARLPKLRNPDTGYIATANNQPTSTKDYYHGSFYDAGYRAARITGRIDEVLRNTGKVSIKEMKEIQGDTYLLLCDDFLKVLTDSVGPKKAQLGETGLAAYSYVDGWKCSSPSGYKYDSDTGDLQLAQDSQVISSSVATSIFHAWISNLAHFTFDDQLGGESFGSQQYARALYNITFRKKCDAVDADAGTACQNTGDGSTGSSVFWDDWGTPDVETRSDIALRAYKEAIEGLTAKFGTSVVSQWLWGKIHTLTVRHLADSESVEGDSAEMFSIPSPTDPIFAKLGLKGFPRPGGQFVVDASDPGLDLMSSKQQSKFSYGSGPSYRIVVEMKPDGPEAYTALPGGNVAHPRSRFYSNQLRELWWANEYKKFPFTREEVRAAAAELLVLEPAGGK